MPVPACFPASIISKDLIKLTGRYQSQRLNSWRSTAQAVDRFLIRENESARRSGAASDARAESPPLWLSSGCMLPSSPHSRLCDKRGPEGFDGRKVLLALLVLADLRCALRRRMRSLR
mmetsp:Transcript_28750/g.66103  ORF Transcript_28750/g.66103 Transcript_28750/m.66103 type:complete len:118 (-) Transcript_28750:101-454(-)